MPVTVLVVDDEVNVGSMMRMVLESDGYQVTLANSAAEALALFASSQAFDLVVTDMRMESPTSGYEVARAASALASDPGIILLTGFPLPGRDWRQTGAHAMLQKPVPIAKLLECVQEILAQRAARRADQK